MPARPTADFGPRASQLPGAEVLSQFRGRPPRTIRQSEGVARLNRRVFLRWFPHQSTDRLPQDEAEVTELIHAAQRHMRLLADVSEGRVEVLSHRSFIGEHPVNPGRLAIITTVEADRGDPVNYSLSRRYNGNDPRNAKSLYTAAAYLRLALDTGEPVYLRDDLRATQFSMGRGGTPNRLIDLDPILDPTDSDFILGERRPLTGTMAAFESWCGDLSPHLADVVLARQVLRDIRAHHGQPAVG